MRRNSAGAEDRPRPGHFAPSPPISGHAATSSSQPAAMPPPAYRYWLPTGRWRFDTPRPAEPPPLPLCRRRRAFILGAIAACSCSTGSLRHAARAMSAIARHRERCAVRDDGTVDVDDTARRVLRRGGQGAVSCWPQARRRAQHFSPARFRRAEQRSAPIYYGGDYRRADASPFLASAGRMPPSARYFMQGVKQRRHARDERDAMARNFGGNTIGAPCALFIFMSRRLFLPPIRRA